MLQLANCCLEYIETWRANNNLERIPLNTCKRGTGVLIVVLCRVQLAKPRLDVRGLFFFFGLVLSSRLSWYAEQASKASFAVKSNLTQLGMLSLDLLFKIYATKILQILI